MPLKHNSTPVAVVTGAGSGVGRAAVQQLAALGWPIALLGRRAQALDETIALCPAAARKHIVPYVCDVGDPAAVDAMAAAVLKKFRRVDVLVNAAGLNVPRRSLSVLSRADYAAMMGANIHGVLYLVQAFLPGMRERGSGTIINVGSDAGKQASPKAGAGYVISKFGLTGLTQSINAEERQNGIRATCVFPGDIDTELLNKRPVPPPPEARKLMLLPEDVGACIRFVATLPARATIEEIVVRPCRSYTG
ncbi:MAG: SDR family oxidoreductase [Opitutus sp.]|nr:SDR family oxidoreductase [Opitutus sp.]